MHETIFKCFTGLAGSTSGLFIETFFTNRSLGLTITVESVYFNFTIDGLPIFSSLILLG